jgi:hypothetical protein
MTINITLSKSLQHEIPRFIVSISLIFFLIYILYYYILKPSYTQDILKKSEARLNTRLRKIDPVTKKKVHDDLRKIAKQKNDRRKQQEARDPELIRNLRTYTTNFRNDPSSSWKLLLDIGNIYQKGQYPLYKPNLTYAEYIYKIAARCPDGDVAGMAMAKYMECFDNNMDKNDIKGSAIPVSFGDQVMAIADNVLKYLPLSAYQKPIFKGSKTNRGRATRNNARNARNENDEAGIGMDNDDVMRDPTIFMAGFDVQDPMGNANDDIANALIDTVPLPIGDWGAGPTNRNGYNDKQNVHAHTIVATTRANVKNLENTDVNGHGRENRPDEVKNQMSDFIMNSDELTEKQKGDALATLDKLNDTLNSALQTSSNQALSSVWTRIHTNKDFDEQTKYNTVETLAKQLADARESGYQVCGTGVISRIIGTLDGVDQSMHQARPMEAVRDEMRTLAATTRDVVLDRASQNEVAKYNNGDITHLDDDIQKEFEDNVNKIYIDELGMSKSVLQPFINETLAGL